MYHDTTSGYYGKENYKQCNCSTAVNTCKISLRSLITLNLLMLTSKQQERFIFALYSNTKKEESSLNKMRYDCFNQLNMSSEFCYFSLQVSSNHRSCTSTLPLRFPPSANIARRVFEPIELGLEVSE
ncbi:hypothetical protein AVEN_208909-1 [Araneus ventricosus]|uniref:Uncharacterized protein n=1 Tax=Araneus ventricosus TaxID=182803 RepID=A0A4Y2EZU7_ARAVE|nr:hypothetical protein AVEN_208909-1 [Araneus ventricosus]